MRSFYGEGTTSKDADAIGMLIDEEHRAPEAELFSRKWFDYRRLHPVEATYKFADEYARAAHRFYVRTYNVEGVSPQEVIGDVFEHRQRTSFWLARQCVDRVGCPYPFALDYAGDRFFNRNFTSYPQPNQLYGEEFELDLTDKWREWCEIGVRHSVDPKTIDTPEHQKWVVEQVAKRPNKAGVLGRLLHQGVIHGGLIERHFGATELAAAERHALLLRSQG